MDVSRLCAAPKTEETIPKQETLCLDYDPHNVWAEGLAS